MLHIIIHSLLVRQTCGTGELQQEIRTNSKDNLLSKADKLKINMPFVAIVLEGAGFSHSQAIVKHLFNVIILIQLDLAGRIFSNPLMSVPLLQLVSFFKYKMNKEISEVRNQRWAFAKIRNVKCGHHPA